MTYDAGVGPATRETRDDEAALEAQLRIDHLKRQRLTSTIYAVLAFGAAVVALLLYWPRSGGMFETRVEWFGSIASARR